MSFSEGETQSLIIISCIVSFFSLIGSGIIILSYYKFPSLRTFSFQLVLMLAISDIGADFAYFFGSPEENDGLCETQALFISFFSLGSVFWTVVIAYILYQTIVKHNIRTWKLSHFSFGVWGTSLLFALLPFSTDSYGESGGSWCWIKSSDKSEFDAGTAWRFFSFYIQLWLAVIFNSWVYWKISVFMNRITSMKQDDEDSVKLLKLVRRMRFYPLILVVCWIFGTINRIENSINPQSPKYTLFLLQSISQSAMGILNAIAYGASQKVQTAWKEEYAGNIFFEKWILRRKDYDDDDNEDDVDQLLDDDAHMNIPLKNTV